LGQLLGIFLYFCKIIRCVENFSSMRFSTSVRFLTTFYLCLSCFFAWAQQVYNFAALQDIKVPQEMAFGDLRLVIDDYARSKIQKDVDRLIRSEQHFQILLERTYRFFPLVEKILVEEQVPEDFKYLAIQESALLADAVSVSNAVGYWQFKKETALEMGLGVNFEVDERKNILMATRAAARYLKRNQYFTKNWIHTLLSYNLGLSGVRNAIKEKEVGASIMDIDGNTHWYVIRCLAHKLVFEEALKAKHEKYLSLLVHPRANGMSLSELSEEMNVPLETIKLYNKWLLTERVPMNRPYAVIIPVENEKAPALARKLPDEPVLIPAPEKTKLAATVLLATEPVKQSKYPVIEKGTAPNNFLINGKPGLVAQAGDTPAKLAERGRMKLHRFLDYNDLEANDKITAGQVFYLAKKDKSGPEPYHTLQPGESLWQVAQQYGIRLHALLSKNRMEEGEKPKPGRVLYLQQKRPKKEPVRYEKVEQPAKNNPVSKPASIKPSPSTEPVMGKDTIPVLATKEKEPVKPVATTVPELKKEVVEKTHTVAENETLYSIAKLYNLSVGQLREWNSMQEKDKLSLGQLLVVVKEEKIVEQIIEHTVQSGESLFKIAWNYRTTVEELMQLNGKTESKIKVGEKLKVKVKCKTC
jgi:membrane-bound lytic murein transglycosylase D